MELPQHDEFHADAIKLNTGRNCLELILRCRKYHRIYLPYYSCDVLLEPLHKLHIDYRFYHINERWEKVDDIQLGNEEALLYINYFGLKKPYVKKLSADYGKQLIIDNTQAFFDPPIKSIDTFYSCRKFFGVSDGAYLYTDADIPEDLEQDISYDRMTFLTKRIDLGAEAGYKDFRDMSRVLSNQPVRRMSKLTERLMQAINYEDVSQRRQSNFIFLQDALYDDNRLHLSPLKGETPMIYPYISRKEGLRDYLISQKVFVALYWPNVLKWCQTTDKDHFMAKNICSLPCDQRYEEKDMQHMVNLIKQWEQN